MYMFLLVASIVPIRAHVRAYIPSFSMLQAGNGPRDEGDCTLGTLTYQPYPQADFQLAGVPKACSHFPKILLTSADLKSSCL